ncbi:MAG TPA: LytTR family DNA-binding domain-containing protein [Candidatus Aminicenantes bacterium]|nr:LytTR family DNA-binding domain-containing protein [Candidatus Aminicenantes bacterium]
MSIRTLVVDDEPLARQRVTSLLRQDSDFELVGEAGDGAEAVATIRRLSPTLVFLDVQMPELDGFQVLRQLEPQRIPYVVFATAYDQFALHAFAVHAVDYLLKPFDDDRFFSCADRVKEQIRQQQHSSLVQRIEDLLAHLPGAAPQYRQRILLREDERMLVLPVERLLYVEAAGYQLKLHEPDGVHLHRETIQHMEQQLDPARFLRIHRSYIVNIDFIKEIQPWFQDDHLLVLRNGDRLPISAKYQKAVFAALRK